MLTIETNTELLLMGRTKKERLHMGKVASMGCVVCVNLGHGETPAELHHISNGAMGKKSSNYEVIPLCHVHHRTGGYGVAVHAGRVQWESNFGTEHELLLQTLLWVGL